MRLKKQLDAFFTRKMFFEQSGACLEHYTREKSAIFATYDVPSSIDALALDLNLADGQFLKEKWSTAVEGSQTEWDNDRGFFQQASTTKLAEETEDSILEGFSSSTDYEESIIDHPKGSHPPTYISECPLFSQKLRTEEELRSFTQVR